MNKIKIFHILNQSELTFILLFILLSLFVTFFTSFQFFSFLPFPDSVYYASGVINLLSGKGFVMALGGVPLSTPLFVPILYPLYLLPFFALSSTLFSFYIANLILAVCSLMIFMKICRALKFPSLLFVLAVSLYITNFLIFWIPSLLMAENLLLLLFLLSIFFLIRPTTQINILVSGIIISAMFFTKYVSWPIGFAFGLVTLIKILSDQCLKSTKFIRIGIICFATLVSFLFIVLLEANLRMSNPLNQFVSHLYTLAQLFTPQSTSTPTPSTISPKIYAADNFIHTLGIYASALLGIEVSISGIYLKILPPLISLVILALPYFMFKRNKLRFISLYFLLSIITTTIFLGFFYEIEGRYLFVFIPAIILCLCFVIKQLTQSIENSLGRILSLIGIILALYSFGFNLLNTFNSIKIINNYQIIFQNYQAVQTLQSLDLTEDTYVITTLSPYYLQLFIHNPNLKYLPLSKMQFYLESPEKTWSIPKKKYEDIYIDLLKENKKVYFLSYATGYPFFYEYDRNSLEQKFNLKLIKSGCNSQCDLFEISLK